MKLLKSLTWLMVMLLAIGMVGCSDDDDDDGNPTGPTTKDFYTDLFDAGNTYYTGGTKNILADSVFAHMNAGVDMFIIDYRTAGDFSTLGHIDGAVNWSIADLTENLSQIPADAEIVNVCYTGQTASQATAVLRLLGYNAYNLKFGMCGWTADETINLGKWTTGLTPGGQTLVTEATTPTATYDVPMIEEDEDMTVDEILLDRLAAYVDVASTHNISAASLYENLNDGDTSNDPFIINYWSEAMYDMGHIPGAVQGSPITTELLSHIEDGQQVVVYCHTGMTSSQLIVWLNVLGYDAYSMLFGMNAIDQDSFGDDLTTYHAPSSNFPVVTGN